MVRVTVWNEYRSEQENEAAAAVYPDGIHTTIADFLDDAGHETRTATLDEPEHGLTAHVLDDTDVLVYWSHNANDEVADEVAARIAEQVLDGMGLLVLHSGLRSKPFHVLMGTRCRVKRRNADETERVWILDPAHQIVEGLDQDYLEFPESQVFAEPFEIPAPDELVMVSWNEGGEVFRSGCCWRRGRGRVFFFGPGHETYPVYHRDDVQRVLTNAVDWAAPVAGPPAEHGRLDGSIEPIGE